jgi:glucose-1-phosphate thymidylyltransferase
MASNLKGLVITGGKGNRLRPLTYTGAKQLVPIANKPILFYAIEQLFEAGIHEITLVVSLETGPQIREAVGDGSRFGFGGCITYVDQERPGGIAQAVGLAKDAMDGAPFVTFLGDNFLTHSIVPHVQAFEASHADAGLLLKHVDDPRGFGVAQFENERLVRVIEKPADPPSNLVVIGIYFFTPRVFDAIAAIKPSARGELEITDTVQWLLDAGANLRADIIDGGWIDTGKHDDLLDANRLILESLPNDHAGGTVDAASKLNDNVVLQAGCEIVDSIINGPAIIGERTRIEHARIGPYTSIGPDCRIVSSEVSGSVIMESTVVERLGHRIESSLIGRNVELRGAAGTGAHQMVLGDYSRARVP